MCHELYEFGIIVAGDKHLTILFADEVHRLAQFVLRETAFHGTQIEFGNHTVGNGIAVENRFPLLHGKALESMAYGMTHIQGLTDAVLLRVFFNDTLFHLDGIGQKLV